MQVFSMHALRSFTLLTKWNVLWHQIWRVNYIPYNFFSAEFSDYTTGGGNTSKWDILVHQCCLQGDGRGPGLTGNRALHSKDPASCCSHGNPSQEHFLLRFLWLETESSAVFLAFQKIFLTSLQLIWNQHQNILCNLLILDQTPLVTITPNKSSSWTCSESGAHSSSFSK